MGKIKIGEPSGINRGKGRRLAKGKGLLVKTLGERVVKDPYGKADEIDGSQDHGGNATDQDGVFGNYTSRLFPQKAK